VRRRRRKNRAATWADSRDSMETKPHKPGLRTIAESHHCGGKGDLSRKNHRGGTCAEKNLGAEKNEKTLPIRMGRPVVVDECIGFGGGWRVTRVGTAKKWGTEGKSRRQSPKARALRKNVGEGFDRFGGNSMASNLNQPGPQHSPTSKLRMGGQRRFSAVKSGGRANGEILGN